MSTWKIVHQCLRSGGGEAGAPGEMERDVGRGEGAAKIRESGGENPLGSFFHPGRFDRDRQRAGIATPGGGVNSSMCGLLVSVCM